MVGGGDLYLHMHTHACSDNLQLIVEDLKTICANVLWLFRNLADDSYDD